MIDISLYSGAGSLWLNGQNVVAPVQRADYSPASGPGETLEDFIDITLGPGGDIAAWMAALERRLVMAQQFRERHIASALSLVVTVNATQGAYQSEILDGWLEQIGKPASGPAQREKGSQVIRLHMTRVNYFELVSGALSQLTVTNRLGSSPYGLTVYNHGDAGHDNFVTIAAADILGSLPARCEIGLLNSVNDARSIRNVYLGLNALCAPGTLVSVLEGEAGTGGAWGPDVTCSGGRAQDFSWSGTGEELLEYWDLDTATLIKLRSNLVRPVGRLRLTHAYADLFYKWKVMVTATSVVVWESDWQLATPAEILQELPLLRLPPYNFDYGGSPGAMKLCLYARRNTAGAHFLTLDFVQLFVTDGFRKWEALHPAPYNWTILDRGFYGTLQTNISLYAGDVITHLGVGSQILLFPGVDNRLTVLWDLDDGDAPYDREAVLSVSYKPRVRCF